MGSNDYFLLESFFISEGNYVDASFPVSLQSAINKVNEATKYNASNGSMPLTITTNADTDNYDDDKFLNSWYAALILGAEGSA
ncbi:MAG: hypothetical protein KA015_02240 [Spirochaetes bacterium]|nr:hypothetical protein [Spirochaetota bacterium]